MGTIFGGIDGTSAPVLVGATRAPCEHRHSFGSDFTRLGAVPTSSALACGKPWQTYPSRRQSPQDSKGLSFGQWQAQRVRDQLVADALIGKPLIPGQVRQHVERWHTSFQAAIERDVVFEDRRTEAMRQARYGVPPTDAPFVRTFGNEAVLDQLERIAHVNDEIERVEAAVEQLPKGPARAMGQQNLDELVSMRDTMLSLTTGLHERKFHELKVELNLLVALNDMAREARQALSNGGAGTPLRLKVRGGKLVLKPAVSKSRFQKNRIRARNDAARLALLLGEPAGTPVTLSDIHAKGFGKYEYSMVLAGARTATPGQASTWLAERALEIDGCKCASRALESDLRETNGGRLIGALPTHRHDDSQFDETGAGEIDEIDATDATDDIDGPEAPAVMPGARTIDEACLRTVPKHVGVAGVPAVILGTFDVLADGSLVPERKGGRAGGHETASDATSTASAAAASRARQPTSSTRRSRLADEFIAVRPGRAGRLSMILERPTAVERMHEGPAPERAPLPAGQTHAGGPETLEARWQREGARPKTYRVLPISDEDSPPALPRTAPPERA
ncbi:hypothetical protein AB870_19025 [Pandoraea faecigallinarum]|uniref:Uncharacterized protein n=1 Tax=Pandoraea faecigallinarum TaxID=656179 RepID=A0A0H3WVI1_9BURK|nr:hypothetical protein [Pandoraea faecigallinarum]AKM31752.1 hypothetical protein AB870_19025 [Pandoraea faecigallinarum]